MDNDDNRFLRCMEEFRKNMNKYTYVKDFISIDSDVDYISAEIRLGYVIVGSVFSNFPDDITEIWGSIDFDNTPSPVPGKDDLNCCIAVCYKTDTYLNEYELCLGTDIKNVNRQDLIIMETLFRTIRSLEEYINANIGVGLDNIIAKIDSIMYDLPYSIKTSHKSSY